MSPVNAKKKDSLLNDIQKNAASFGKKKKLDPSTRIKFKYIIDLNVKYEKIKVVEENIGEYLYNLVWGNFLIIIHT